jgi:hypothetical protein
MKARITITLALLIYPCFLFSQITMETGFIVNNSNDTIWGEGKVDILQKFCIFQQNNTQVALKYLPNDIKCIRFLNGKYFISKKVTTIRHKFILFVMDSIVTKSEQYFLEYLLDGKVDLYVLQDFAERLYFIEKPGMPISELQFNETILEQNGKFFFYTNSRFKGFLKIYMNDSPQICERIDKIRRVTQRSLVDLLEDYHHSVCTDYECINYTKKFHGQRPKNIRTTNK